jgi:hypothetical protein
MKGKRLGISILALFTLFCIASPLFAQNQVLGRIDFSAATKVEKTSGVWIDGQYVGFVKELRGAKKIMLLPGDHEISIRQLGYSDFSQKVTVEPGQTQVVRVTMQKAPGATWSSTTVAMKLDVQPERAAVFLDDAFVGHAGEFGGAFHSMLVSPGKHQIKVELPGYQTFETEVNLRVGQKTELKTELVPGSIDQAGPLIKQSNIESSQAHE